MKGDFMADNAPSKENKEQKTRAYRVAVVMLYKLNGEFHAKIAHPKRDIPEDAVKKAKEGINTALGKWLDLGYSFGNQKDGIPDFCQIPKGAQIIGHRPITQVPFPI